MNEFAYTCIGVVFTFLHIINSMMSDALRFASSGLIKEMLQKKYGKDEELLEREVQKMDHFFNSEGKNLREMEWGTTTFLLIALFAFLNKWSMNGSDIYGNWFIGQKVFIYLALVFGCSSILLRAFTEPFAEKIILFFYSFWRVMHFFLKPFTMLIDFLQALTLRVAGQEKEEEEEEHEQKILDSVDDGEKAGVFEDSERKMIENLIEFKDRDVGEVMTPRTEMVAVSQDSEAEKIIELMQEEKLSRILIFEENRDNIIGFVHVRDLLPYWNHKKEFPELKTLIHEPFFVPETKKIRSLFQELKEKHVHIAVVLDEYGGTAGLITLEDILEEIVGEIVDEHQEKEEILITPIAEDEFVVNAKCRVTDLAETLNIEIEENEQFDSVGGLIISHLGKIPSEGEQGEMDDLKLFFKITSANERKIDELIIKKINKNEND